MEQSPRRPAKNASRAQTPPAAEQSGRVYPHNLDAERAVLGGILLDNDVLPSVQEHLDAEDFYRETHRLIFQHMVELSQSSRPIDLVTLVEHLRNSGNLEVVGGLNYLMGLSDAVPVTTNVASYAVIIREKAVLRRLIEATTQINEKVLNTDGEFKEILDFAETTIFKVTEVRGGRAFTHISQILDATFEHIQKLFDRKQSITGIPTGLSGLDKLLAGLQNSDLLILAARPAMGKTAFALNMASNAALRSGISTAVFSLEMSKEQLAMRMLTSEAKVDASKIKTGQLNEDDWKLLIKAAEHMYDAPIYIDDTPGVSINELRSKVRRLKQEKGLGLLVVDYLQLMTGSAKTNSREQEISEISRGLKGVAKELNIPVIALSQLNRGLESRTDKRPMMSDLRESGAIEQDADIIMFIYRDWVYKRKESPEFENDEELKRKAEIIIGKHRSGPTGTVHAIFLGEYSSFVNAAEEFRGDDA